MAKSFLDQLGTPITLTRPPSRIISLVPSQTELLFDLGLNKEIAGITKFCIHPPEWQKEKTIIGGTKNFNLDIIDSLKPDLIIGNKEENYKTGIEQLQKKYPVWMSDIITLEHAMDMIRSIGEITETNKKASAIMNDIETAFRSIIPKTPKKILYLIWRQPWMAAGAHTFIHTMIEKIGLKNSLNTRQRYPEISSDEIKNLNSDLIFLSSEPYPFKEKHIYEIQEIVPSAKILLVDGEMFSWYGSRLKLAPQYFNSLKIE